MPPKKMGRPVSENPKDKMLKIRMDNQMMKMLDECSEAFGINRSEIVRQGIKMMHDSLNKK